MRGDHVGPLTGIFHPQHAHEPHRTLMFCLKTVGRAKSSEDLIISSVNQMLLTIYLAVARNYQAHTSVSSGVLKYGQGRRAKTEEYCLSHSVRNHQ